MQLGDEIVDGRLRRPWLRGGAEPGHHFLRIDVFGHAVTAARDGSAISPEADAADPLGRGVDHLDRRAIPAQRLPGAWDAAETRGDELRDRPAFVGRQVQPVFGVNLGDGPMTVNDDRVIRRS